MLPIVTSYQEYGVLRGKKSNFAAKNPGRHYLSQLIKLNINITRIVYSFDMTQ